LDIQLGKQSGNVALWRLGYIKPVPKKGEKEGTKK
jgi:hypothetical protein